LGYNVSYTRSLADLVPVAADAQVGVDEDGAYEDFTGDRGDREVVKGAVKQTGRALAYASEDFTGDRGVVLEAVK
jgi:hypothetical protein